MIEMRHAGPNVYNDVPQHMMSVDFLEGMVPLGTVFQDGAGGGQYFRSTARVSDKFLIKSGFYYSVTFSFDNLNKSVIPRHYSSTTKTEVMNMTSAFVSFSRIPLRWNEMSSPHTRIKFTDLPITTWLPSASDVNLMKYDIRRGIRKILVKHIALF